MAEARIIHGDCLDVLFTFESRSVGHVVTDPPYGQTNEKYDSPIAFAPAIWSECHRVTGPNAALVAFAGSPTYHRIASAIEAAGWKVRQMWGWVYRDGLVTSAWPKDGFDRLVPAFDPIVYATKGKVLLNVEREGRMGWRKTGGPDTPAGFSDRSNGKALKEGIGRRPRSLVSDGRVPFEYFDMPRTNGGSTEQHGHPNQKPVQLMRWLIARLPSSGAILDLFAGSGSTLVAARLEGRDAIGIEADPAYAEIAERRLAGPPMPLFDDGPGVPEQASLF